MAQKNKITYTRDYFVTQGRKGGNQTLAAKGAGHFKIISKKAVKARKKYGKTKN